MPAPSGASSGGVASQAQPHRSVRHDRRGRRGMMSHSVLIRTMWELFVAKSPHVVSKRTTWENFEVMTMTMTTRRVTA